MATERQPTGRAMAAEPSATLADVQRWVADPVPSETIAAVRDGTRGLVDQVVAAVRRENPIYADVLGGPEGMGIRLGIEQAIKSFLDAVERGQRPGAETDEVWRRLGEAEFQAGRSLEALRSAFRTGARAAWRGAAELAAQAGMEAPIVIALAEAIFVYTDELATDVVEGYRRIQSDEAGELDRRRRRLAALLTDGEPHDPDTISHAAELARWPLPRTVAAVALAGEAPAELTRRLDPGALVGGDYLVLPDPGGPGRRSAIDRATRGFNAALGPAVAPAEAVRSLRWAKLALRLATRGALHGEGQEPIRVDEHLATMILLQDRGLAHRLLANRLAPLDQLLHAERERLIETLEAWLAHQRHTPAIARELHVHPQTVRYRMAKLRELLGDAIDSADGRFELQLALRIRRADPG